MATGPRKGKMKPSPNAKTIALNAGPSSPVRVYTDGENPWVAPIKQPFKIKKMKV